MTTAPELDRTDALARAILARELSEPQPLTVAEWSALHRYVRSGTSPRPGKFVAFPYQLEPMESFTDPAVQVTVLDWASRTGKTEMLNCLDGYCIHHRPCGILVVYPTIDSAKTWRREFFDPMVEATPVLRDLIPPPRSRSGGNTLLHIKFPGGFIRGIGTNSPSAFRQIQAPTVRMDEIDAMLEGREGDPITLGFKRADNYSDSIQVLASTPTIKGMSRIEAWLIRSDDRHWNVPCPHCGRPQVLRWEQVDWISGKPQTAVLLCAHSECGKSFDDRARIDAVMSGRWQPTRDFGGIRGYWLNGLNSLFPAKKGFVSKLHQFTQEFLDAKAGLEFQGDGRKGIMAWTNTFKAETYEDEGDSIESDPLLKRREAFTIHSATGELLPLPAGVLVLTVGVDTQDDRLEAELVGWGEGEESWSLDHVVFLGNPSHPSRRGQPNVWAQLDEWLLKEYRTTTGHALHVAATCIDSGGHKSSSVYAFVRPRQMRRVFAVRGSSSHATPIVSRPPKSKVKKVTLLIIGTDTTKELIFSRLQLSEPGPGYMHFPQDRPEEYFRQLTSEKGFTTFVHGAAVKVFRKTQHPRNEALDMRVYATAAFKLLNANLALIAKRLATPLDPADSEPTPAAPSEAPTPKSDLAAATKRPAQRTTRRPRFGGWMS